MLFYVHLLCIILILLKKKYIFDDIIHRNFKRTCETNEFINKFDKAFFNENKFKDDDITFVGIITKVDDNDKNEIKDKTDKK